MSFWNRFKPSRPRFNTKGMVAQYREMDPKTEDLLEDGTMLEDGMVVLAESRIRANLTELETEADYHVARRFNRWCTVSNIIGPNSYIMKFTATYEDGVKSRITVNQSYSWLVKIDSMPKGLQHVSEDMLPAGDDHCMDIPSGVDPMAVTPNKDIKKVSDPIGWTREEFQEYRNSFRNKKSPKRDKDGNLLSLGKPVEKITLNDLSNNDVALLLMQRGETFDDDFIIGFPSGKTVTGKQMTQLLQELEDH